MKRISLVLLVLVSLAVPCGAQRKGWLVLNVVRDDAPRDKPVSIGVVGADGSGMKLLEAGGIDPSFSPDGADVIYSRIQPAGTSTIMSVPAAGGTSRILTQVKGFAFAPVWSPDRKRIAFYTMPLAQGDVPKSWMIDADGKGLAQIAGDNVMFPRWSPDGKHLGYIVLDEKNRRTSIVVANADGTSPKTVREGTEGGFLFLAWSPDSRRIAWVAVSSKSSQIRVMDADGKNPSELTSAPGIRTGPEFSDDGKQIYYSRIDLELKTSAVMSVAPGSDEKLVASAPAGTMYCMSGGFLLWSRPSAQ